MSKHLILCLISFALIFGCKKTQIEKNVQFKIGRDFVGGINDSTQVKDLKVIFANDSIVNYQEDDSFVGGLNAIDIFEKNGNPLLSVFPYEALDSTSIIDFIQLKDSRYKTEKGICNLSIFQEIKSVYTISEIQNNLNTIKIIINEIDATFVINKNELLSTFDFGVKVDTTQIPNGTKFSSFIINF
ncbi:MAG: hypothetical protein HKP48_03240 [Winogradskyella sp.]|uniref:hypothetical protein n=1 Tax=Winogradskyella sp. TaxID=1883156 RepID=UPI0018454D50|nr:hypothetical protein [Winogradskyella sp.]MBT8243674.1 hypothetical protein [Winogradskyella sp.]NNK22323.1 hypothetical protein [Winogradskyella sp.]